MNISKIPDGPWESGLSPDEVEVRHLLGAYKLALVCANYQNIWHRLSCFFGSSDALRTEKMVQDAKNRVVQALNRSDGNRDILRRIIEAQPEFVREKDGFLKLIQLN